jgi:hypothetical protein
MLKKRNFPRTSPSRVSKEVRPSRVLKEVRPDFGPFGTECGKEFILSLIKFNNDLQINAVNKRPNTIIV